MPPRRRKAAPKRRAPPKERAPVRRRAAPRRRVYFDEAPQYIPPPVPQMQPLPPLPVIDFTPKPLYVPQPMPTWQPPVPQYYGPTATEIAARDAKMRADYAAIDLQRDIDLAKIQSDMNYHQQKAELRQIGGNLQDLRRDHDALKLETAIIDGELTLVKW